MFVSGLAVICLTAAVLLPVGVKANPKPEAKPLTVEAHVQVNTGE